jgi:hypothetical protein
MTQSIKRQPTCSSARDLRAGDGFGPLPGAPPADPPPAHSPGLSCAIANPWRRTRIFTSALVRADTFRLFLACIGLILVAPTAHAAESEESPCADRHPMNDAWFTGPMLANTAATAPRGHYLIEPYVYDVTTQGTYSARGIRHSAPHENSYGSLTYVIYGLNDKTGIGLIPTFGYNSISNESSSAVPGPGDLTVQIQRRLTQFLPCGRIPTISVAVQQTLPTGKYDQLGNHPADGYGAGAFATNPALNSQYYFWLPNRRIVRVRFDASDAFSSPVNIQNASVYGTSAGFRGTAHPGSSLFLDASFEYSATRSWVMALDATYRNTANTRVTGNYAQNSSSTATLETNSGWSDAYGLAPAVEYSWRPWIGVLLGVRLIPAGHNTSDTITPAIAVNIVH